MEILEVDGESLHRFVSNPVYLYAAKILLMDMHSSLGEKLLVSSQFLLLHAQYYPCLHSNVANSSFLKTLKYFFFQVSSLLAGRCARIYQTVITGRTPTLKSAAFKHYDDTTSAIRNTVRSVIPGPTFLFPLSSSSLLFFELSHSVLSLYLPLFLSLAHTLVHKTLAME